MAEINVTRLIATLNPNAVAGSIATHGKKGIKALWPNATANATETPLEVANREDIRSWAAAFGAWEDEEIAAWSDAELDALVIQYAAQDLKELQDLCPGEGLGDIDWEEAEELAQAGTVGGSLFASGHRLFIHVEG